MTAITILGGDFEILFEDETVGTNAVAGMKMVRRTSGASGTKYTTNALYSAVADASDDFQAMGFENPMLPVTPNAYTMENEYFIPRSSTEWLEEGAIAADWTVTAGLGVYRKEWVGGTGPVTGDIGRQVIEAGSTDSGTLLDFEIEPDGTTVVWIRPDTAGDVFSTTGALSCTVDGGAFSSTSSVAAISGSTLYSSIQVIGSVPTATDVYLYQDRQKMTDSTGAFQWWTTDTTVSLGIIDILIRVKNADISVADGDVEVFARRYTSLYDNFRLNVAAGGRSALPLASAPDTNNTTGYRAFTGGTGVNTFDVGNGIYVGASWAAATVRGVLTAVGGTVANPELEYYLVGDLTDFVNTDAVKEYIFATAIDGDATCVATAPAANLGGPTDPAAGEGGTVTITLGNNLIDHDGDAATEPYSVTVDAQGDVTAAKVYERIKYVTRRGSDSSFWATITPTDIPGETYRGLELQAQITADEVLWDEGDNVIVDITGYTARAISRNGPDTYVMLTDQQSSIKTLEAADALDDEENNSVTITGTPVTIVSPKNSPFGTFTGSQIFGAQGVVYINPHTSDTQNYILIDDNGTQRTPPNTVSFIVNNTLALDRILVARDTGTSGIIDKDQFGGVATGALAAGTITTTTTPLDSEVAESGYLRVIDTGLQQEHHYVYSSRVLSTGVFTLKPITDALISATGTPVAGIATLTKATGPSFITEGVEVGMLIRNTGPTGLTTEVWEVVSVTDLNNLVAKQLYGTLDVNQDFVIGDTVTINKLIGNHTVPLAYGTDDDLFDLLVDVEATGTSVNNTFVKTLAADFGVVVNVRQGKIILPFNQNPSVGDGGGSVTVVRTPDTIAT